VTQLESAACAPAPLVLRFLAHSTCASSHEGCLGGSVQAPVLSWSGWSCSRVSPCSPAGSALAQWELREARGPGGLRGRWPLWGRWTGRCLLGLWLGV